MGINNSPRYEGAPTPSPLPSATVSESREHHLAIAERDACTLERILSPDAGPFADYGERGAICVITESTGVSRSTLLVREVVEPDEDDLNVIERSLGVELEFTPKYKRRARRIAKDIPETAGLLYVHSHPAELASGDFSDGDRAHDRAQLYEEVQQFENDEIPLAAAVVHDGDDPWRVWRYDYRRARTPSQKQSDAFGPESVECTAITAVRVVGVTIQKRRTGDGSGLYGPVSGYGKLNEAQQDSTIKIWGKIGQRKFAGLRVAIIGCGGGGSVLAETLARLGVGELVLIDFDRVKDENANRHLGATPEDLEQNRDKAEVCSRVARRSATCPDFKARTVVGSVFENSEDEPRWTKYDALEHVFDCDVVMNAADPATVRCTVGRLAYAHLIPVVDAGTRLQSKDGHLTGKSRSTVTVASPGLPCLSCAGQWNDGDFEKALIGEDPQGGYGDEEDGDEDDDEPMRDPSAMPYNLLTMGLATQRFIHLVHGLTPELAVRKAIVRLNSWSTEWEKRDRYSDLRTCHDSCNRPATGTGDDADLKRGPDQKLREERG